MNDLDKNTGEGTKIPNAPYIPIKRRVITSGETRLSIPLNVSPFLPYISGGRICPGDRLTTRYSAERSSFLARQGAGDVGRSCEGRLNGTREGGGVLTRPAEGACPMDGGRSGRGGPDGDLGLRDSPTVSLQTSPSSCP